MNADQQESIYAFVEVNSVKWRISVCETGAAIKSFTGTADCGTIYQKKDIESAIRDLEDGDSTKVDEIAKHGWKFLAVERDSLEEARAYLMERINKYDFAAHEQDMKEILYKAAGKTLGE